MSAPGQRHILLLGGDELAAWAPRLSALQIDATVAAALPALTSGEYEALVLEDVTLADEILPRCDAAGIRLLLWGTTRESRRIAARLGLHEPIDPANALDELTAALGPALTVAQAPTPPAGRTIVVWGPHGAPGRSTVAIGLAAELAHRGHRTLLVDADAHAPSHALLLGLEEHAPGFAAACRRALSAELDAAELGRIAARLTIGQGTLFALAGINRPSRWVELSYPRVRAALAQFRTLADYVIVDVAAPLETDEELVSDEYVPARNAATLAALAAADDLVAVASAEPLSIARFLRDYPEAQSLAPAAETHVVVNRTRGGALGVDPRGQVRRTLERFAGVESVSFLPFDTKGADAAVLGSAPVLSVAPRAQLAHGIRSLADRLLKTRKAA